MIRVEIFNDHPRHTINGSAFKLLARQVLRREGTRTATCSVVFTDDARIRGLNRRFLRSDRTTDVIAFPLHGRGEEIEGEVYVNLDQARRQSRRYHVTAKNEVGRLVVHGVLHLLGYRDKTPRQKARMTKRQEEYLHLLH
jgi:probable rRNA maturation factor